MENIFKLAQSVGQEIVLLSSVTNFAALAILLSLIGLILSVFSVSVKTAVFGFPKISGFLLFIYFVAGLAVFSLSFSDYQWGGGKVFPSLASAIIYSAVLTASLYLSYALFYAFGAFVAHRGDERRLCMEKTAATKAQAVAILDEAQIPTELLKGTALKISTDKMGTLKPRLDDKINFAKALNAAESLSKTTLTNLERATLNRALRVIKHCKNTELTEISRRTLNTAFEEIVKLSARSGGGF